MSSSNFDKRKSTLEKRILGSAKQLSLLFSIRQVLDKGTIGSFFVFRTKHTKGLVVMLHAESGGVVVFPSGEKTSTVEIYVGELDLSPVPVLQKVKNKTNENVRAVTQDFKTRFSAYREEVLIKCREMKPAVQDVIDRDKQGKELIEALKLKKSLFGALVSSLKKQPRRRAMQHQPRVSNIFEDDGGPIEYEKGIVPAAMIEDDVPSFEVLASLFHQKGVILGNMKCVSSGKDGELLLLRFVSGQKLFGRILWVKGDEFPTWLVPNGGGMRDATSAEKYFLIEMLKKALEPTMVTFPN